MRPRPGGVLVATLGLLVFVACAHLLPPSWRSFDVSPSLARPATIAALKKLRMPLIDNEPGVSEVKTEWTILPDGAKRRRERLIVRWEIDERDKVLTFYVRHEAQDEDLGFGGGTGHGRWGNVYHDRDEETRVLDEIETQIKVLKDAMEEAPTS